MSQDHCVASFEMSWRSIFITIFVVDSFVRVKFIEHKSSIAFDFHSRRRGHERIAGPFPEARGPSAISHLPSGWDADTAPADPGGGHWRVQRRRRRSDAHRRRPRCCKLSHRRKRKLSLARGRRAGRGHAPSRCRRRHAGSGARSAPRPTRGPALLRGVVGLSSQRALCCAGAGAAMLPVTQAPGSHGRTHGCQAWACEPLGGTSSRAIVGHAVQRVCI